MICDPLLLSAEDIRHLERGIDEFNRGLFFECHETLEDLWQGIRGRGRSFFQGLIQLAVGFYHLDNGNLKGGASQLDKGLRNLEGYGSRFAGIELDPLRREVGSWLARVRGGRELGGPVEGLPKIRMSAEGGRSAQDGR
jgi:predicted metal-dependent hydrolase